jgi:hypothetical protein
VYFLILLNRENLIEGNGVALGGSGAWHTKLETALQSKPVMPRVPKQSPVFSESLGGKNAAARSPSQSVPKSTLFCIDVKRLVVDPMPVTLQLYKYIFSLSCTLTKVSYKILNGIKLSKGFQRH